MIEEMRARSASLLVALLAGATVIAACTSNEDLNWGGEGSETTPLGDEQFDGSIDRLRLWKRARSPGAIAVEAGL